MFSRDISLAVTGGPLVCIQHDFSPAFGPAVRLGIKLHLQRKVRAEVFHRLYSQAYLAQFPTEV